MKFQLRCLTLVNSAHVVNDLDHHKQTILINSNSDSSGVYSAKEIEIFESSLTKKSKQQLKYLRSNTDQLNRIKASSKLVRKKQTNTKKLASTQEQQDQVCESYYLNSSLPCRMSNKKNTSNIFDDYPTSFNNNNHGFTIFFNQIT